MANDPDLQQHGPALRRLASALVGEQHADDLLQDAAVELLRQPEPPRSPVGWLASALRKLAGKRAREAVRRRRRERCAARPEALPPADASSELADSLRRLADAVPAAFAR